MAYILACLAFMLPLTGVRAQESNPFDRAASALAQADVSPTAVALQSEAEKSALRADILPPDPEVEMEYLWPSATSAPNRWSIGVSQELPDFRRMMRTRKALSALDTLSTLTTRQARTEALCEARLKLAEYVALKRSLRLRQQLAADMDSLLAAYTRAWNHGEVNILDLNKIKIEHARALSSLETTRGELNAMEAQLLTSGAGRLTARMLADVEEYPIWQTARGIAMSDSLSLISLVANSPRALAASANLKLLDAEASLATSRDLPALTLGYLHAYEDGTHFNGFSAALTLPVFSRNARHEAALSRRLAERVTTDRSLQLLTAETIATARRARSLQASVALLTPAVENTNNLRLLRLALDGGEINLLTYLQELKYFTEAQAQYDDALREYYQCLARLASLSDEYSAAASKQGHALAANSR